MEADDLIARLVAHGVPAKVAQDVLRQIDAAQTGHAPQEAWHHISREVLKPARDFELHVELYRRCYGADAVARVDRPAWIPTPEVIDRANATDAASRLGLGDYHALHRWSVENRDEYWRLVIERLGLVFRQPCSRIADFTDPLHPDWLVGARMNIVDSCFCADPREPAIIEWTGTGALRRVTYGELQQLTARVANGLRDAGIRPGDAIGLVMPLSLRSVAIYLGIIAAGGVVVSIADSFSGDEIMLRLRLAGASTVFTQDVVYWGPKRLELYQKLVAAGAPPIVAVPAAAESPPQLRDGDRLLDDVLSPDVQFRPVSRKPNDPINVLFSSGTTGEPKAIPWDHTIPIKCAADAHFHQDLHPGDIACWPTSLGWMMGPWLIFSSLLNRATMALYLQAPTDSGFGTFVHQAGVTLLGLVPSLVRTWRQSGCMERVDWTEIRAFSSTGECSNPGDMLYLMHLAGYRPVIEYCGGTELGGAYVAGTVVQPCIPSTFTTPALGMNFVLLDNDRPAEKGEVFIEGPAIGLSTRLLNRDHDAIYYRNAPTNADGIPLRRHGDELETLSNGYYRVAGRSDDTMNLGGIKVGCAEIERVLNQLPGVQETAAVAVPPPGGGPSRLVVFVVRCRGASVGATALQAECQRSISAHLNPLFHVEEVRLAEALPRTASNKIMRRELRAQCLRMSGTP